jgi:adenylate cyclase
VEVAKRAIRSYPDVPQPYRWLAAALGQLGRIEEAKEALEQAVAIVPGSFETNVRQRVPWHRLEDYAHMLEGLRKAGLQGWRSTEPEAGTAASRGDCHYRYIDHI